MQKANDLPYPQAATPDSASVVPGGKAGQVLDVSACLKLVLELLTYLKLSIEDVRAQLTAKRKDFSTVEELANLVGRSPYTVRRWIAEGRIKAIRVDGTGPKGRLLIPRDQIDVLVAGGMAAAVPDAVVD